MNLEIGEKIGNCKICNKKGEIIHIKSSLIHLRWGFYCEKCWFERNKNKKLLE